MTKEVLVRISGLQQPEPEEEQLSEDEPLEVVTPASYYLKNGKHYILYEEPVEGMPGVIKNRIKISEKSCVEIIKTGITNSHMIFEPNKKNLTYYQTPYGQMLIGVYTTRMNVQVSENAIEVLVNYELDINHQPYADCEINMNICSRAEGESLIL